MYFLSYHSIIHNHITGSPLHADVNIDYIIISISFDCKDVIIEKNRDISLWQLNIFDIECNVDGMDLYLEEGVFSTVMVVRHTEVKSVINKTLFIWKGKYFIDTKKWINTLFNSWHPTF